MRLLVVGVLLLAATGCAPSPPPEPLFPSEIGGLPVITVTQALAARDAGRPGPHAVGGWFSAESIAHSCPAPISARSPLEYGCHPEHWGLAERREPVVSVQRSSAGGFESTEMRVGIAQGPWVQPVMDLDQPIFADGADRTVPVPVVLIGHFDDVRAAACPPEERTACRGRFVATTLGWVAGRAP